MNWNDAIPLLGELGLVRQRLGIAGQAHQQGEITELARAFRDGRTPEHYVGRLTRCVVATDATELHRLSACRQLLMIAEMTLNVPLAEFAFRAVLEPSSQSLRHALTAMIFHTCFGSPAKAKEMASLIFDQAQNEPARLPLILNAAYADSRIGDWTVAEARLTHAVEMARRGNARGGEMHVRLFLARLYYSVGRFDASRNWYDRFKELLSEVAGEESVWEHNLLGARLAATEGDLDLMQNHLEGAKASPFSKLPLAALLTRACEIEHRFYRGCEPCTIPQLEGLLASYERGRTLGFQDDTVRALSIALRFHNRESDAKVLVREYLTLYRRDGYPPDPSLVAAHQD
jgi:hypothetical protein